ncbi:MAG TPA: hypothetical protein ACFYEM_07670, partial [Candidatus Hypogeohydataceae bacterium YC40]
GESALQNDWRAFSLWRDFGAKAPRNDSTLHLHYRFFAPLRMTALLLIKGGGKGALPPYIFGKVLN